MREVKSRDDYECIADHVRKETAFWYTGYVKQILIKNLDIDFVKENIDIQQILKYLQNIPETEKQMIVEQFAPMFDDMYDLDIYLNNAELFFSIQNEEK